MRGASRCGTRPGRTRIAGLNESSVINDEMEGGDQKVNLNMDQNRL